MMTLRVILLNMGLREALQAAEHCIPEHPTSVEDRVAVPLWVLQTLVRASERRLRERVEEAHRSKDGIHQSGKG